MGAHICMFKANFLLELILPFISHNISISIYLFIYIYTSYNIARNYPLNHPRKGSQERPDEAGSQVPCAPFLVPICPGGEACWLVVGGFHTWEVSPNGWFLLGKIPSTFGWWLEIMMFSIWRFPKSSSICRWFFFLSDEPSINRGIPISGTPHILGIIIPTDRLIFFRGVAQPPASLLDIVGAKTR